MPKGGMCKNPFAGNASLNNLDDEFMASLFKGELTVDGAISLRVIKMSVRDYLFFGLGKNGITPERFLEAFFYLYKVSSQDPRTWGDCGLSERYRNSDGLIESRQDTLLPKEVQAKCFDTHFDLSGLATHLSIASFRKKLKTKRAQIVNANIKQALSYMAKCRNEEWRSLPKASRKGKHNFTGLNAVHLLTDPSDAKSFAQLYLFGRVLRLEDNLGSSASKGPRSLRYKTLLFDDNHLS